jgi:hypothetical protein
MVVVPVAGISTTTSCCVKFDSRRLVTPRLGPVSYYYHDNSKWQQNQYSEPVAAIIVMVVVIK